MWIREKSLTSICHKIITKPTQPNKFENDASARSPNLSWSMTSGPAKLNVSCLCPVDQLCQLASKSVRSFSKYCVHKFGNRQTDRRVENIMFPPASMTRRWHKKAEENKFPACISMPIHPLFAIATEVRSKLVMSSKNISIRCSQKHFTLCRGLTAE